MAGRGGSARFGAVEAARDPRLGFLRLRAHRRQTFRVLIAGTRRALRTSMRLAAALLALALAPAIAAARPVTLGISAGVHHDEADPDDESNRTLGLFGRVAFSSRVWGQLEVLKIETDDAYYTPTTIRTATVLLGVDLVSQGRWVPTIKVGAGLDRASTEWDTEEGHHYEGGLGLEYRAEGGMTIGIDLRLGGRSVDEPEYELLADDTEPAPLYWDGGGLREGEYRSARLWLGVTF